MTAKVETPRSAQSVHPSGSPSGAFSPSSHTSGPSTPGLRLNLGDLEPNDIRPHHHKRQLSASGAGFPCSGTSSLFDDFVSSSENHTGVQVKGAPHEARRDENARRPLGQRGTFSRSPSDSATFKTHRPGMSHSSSSPQLSSPRHLADILGDGSGSMIPPPSDARKHRHHVSPTRAPIISVGSAPSPAPSRSSSGGVLVSTVRDRANRGQASRRPARSDSLSDVKGISVGSNSDDEPDRRSHTPNESAVEDEYRDSPLDNSARYYHRNPYSKSASTSPIRDPSLLLPEIPKGNNSFGPVGSLLARRRLSDSSNPLANGSLDVASASKPQAGDLLRSPSHSPTSFLKGTDINANGRLVILTPTTQEWRELGFENLRALGGQGGSSERDGERGRKTSWESADSDLTSDGYEWTGVPRRPELRTTTSADPLEPTGEDAEVPGGSGSNALGFDPANEDFDRPVVLTIPPQTSGTTSISRGGSSRASSRRNSMPNVPQSAPPLLEEGDLFARLIGMQVDERQKTRAIEAEGDDSIEIGSAGSAAIVPSEGLDIGDNTPVTISRSQSMKETGDGPKRKEKERERLFRLVGEDVEKNGIQKPLGGWGIKQIGTRGGLSALSSPATPPANDATASSRAVPEDRPSGLPESPTASSPVSEAPRRRIEGLHPEGKPKPAPPNRLVSTVSSIGGLSMTSTKPVAHPSPLHAVTSSIPTIVSPGESSTSETSQPSRSQSRAHSRSPTKMEPQHESQAASTQVEPVSPITSRRRQSQRLSSLAGRASQPFAFPAALPPSHPTNRKPATGLLSAFSPFTSTNGAGSKGESRPAMSREPTAQPLLSVPHYLQTSDRSDSMISIAPSTRAPSEPATPLGETAGGMGGHGINDYVIVSEAGKGAYGLVKRARQKGWDGEPMGDEVIIKYIIKSRILADCWKKHKILGPIPIEIHVMDQLRNVPFKRPPQAYPWDPLRGQTQPSNVVEEDYFSSASTTATPNSDTGETTPTARTGAVPGSSVVILSPETRPLTEGNLSSLVGGDVNPLEWHAKISAETVKNRGHPNICKMLDFFEDREFYYLVMPRFGVGLDLFDRVESAPDGLPAFEIRSLLGQLSDALRFLHANGVVHRDIKDENVVLDGQGHCQLIDFGSAAHWRPGRKWDTFSGTLDYASPEILRGEMYSGKEQDVWALGVVGYVLICGETPFLSADEAQAGLGVDSKPYAALMRRCSGPRGQEGLEADGGGKMKHAYDFVQRCLEMKPEDRPPAEALVKHRFVLGRGGWVGHRNWIQEGQA